MSYTRVMTDFIYIYGVILAEELQYSEVPSILGIDHKEVTFKTFNNLAAVITPVSAQNYSQQQIDLLLKDAEWLKQRAFHHHEVISIIHQHYSVLPMSFCTIFQDENNLENLLIEQYDVILKKLFSLKGKQEWNVKLFCQIDRTLSYVIENNTAVVELRGKLATMPKGKQFLMKKKLEHLIASQIELEQSNWWQEINDELSPFVNDLNLRQNWGKEVTERTDEMIVNCDFLIEKGTSAYFLNKIQELEESFEALGCAFQVTGPWPPYHFSKMEKETK
ncbi:GvpL/GvpF family gas vesicle protein [Neobacillus rhizosphaerae]|uniref:GvpL/GvpF family gas vesicle protein n=1 Tax=Neobacillus rhizosphaerae TaxID=2880965 RepID=UPI003D26582D